MIIAVILVTIHARLVYVRNVFGCQMRNVIVQIVSKFAVRLHASNITKNLANQRELIFLRNASHRSSVKRVHLLLNENDRTIIDAVSIYVMCVKNMFCQIICVTCKPNRQKDQTTILYFTTLRQTFPQVNMWLTLLLLSMLVGRSLCLKGTVHCMNFASLYFP